MTTVRRRHAGDLVDPEAIAARLRDEGHTVGKTRTAILEAVRSKQRAFTAEELAESLGETHVSTVYRTLALLEEIGVVRHIHLSHGPAIYERTGCLVRGASSGVRVVRPPCRRAAAGVRCRPSHAAT
jgi:Ferric uptake regulator family